MTYHDMGPNDLPYHLPPFDTRLRALAHFGVLPFPFVQILVRIDLTNGGRGRTY
jgi:hypothetical protein